MKKFNCDMCTAEMVQVSQSKSKKRYKIRRFVCPLCGFKKTIFGSGELDESYFFDDAVRYSDKLFKQESKNREL